MALIGGGDMGDAEDDGEPEAEGHEPWMVVMTGYRKASGARNLGQDQFE